jgi:putative DNA primase/helicase
MGFPASNSPSDAMPYTTAGRVRARKVRWLWWERVAEGSVTVLAGRSGGGKSTIATALVADVTGGPRLPCQVGPRIRGGVLWLSAEESPAKVMKPRFRAAGARAGKVVYPGVDDDGITQHFVELPADLHHLRLMVLDLDVRLIVLDPLASFCPQVDLNQQQPVRELMKGLRTVSEQTGVAWVLICHPNKTRTGPVEDRIFGSGAIKDFARSVLLVGGHPEADGRQVVVHVKASEGQVSPSLAFRFRRDPAGKVPPTLDWCGEVPVTKEMLGVEALDAGELDQHRDARELLRSLVKEWRPSKEVMSEALAAGIGERTLRTAKAELAIPSRRVANGFGPPHWEWGPPPPPKGGST